MPLESADKNVGVAGLEARSTKGDEIFVYMGAAARR
jgi:hypothetical protein